MISEWMVTNKALLAGVSAAAVGAAASYTIAEWIFTNKCNALVGEDGYALQGEALRKALAQGKAVRKCKLILKLNRKHLTTSSSV